MTFRARLTISWTIAFGLLLAGANLAIYGTFRAYLDRDVDLKVRTLAATELASSVDGPDIHLHEVPSDAFGEGDSAGKFVQILEADGRLRLSSASLQGVPPLVTPAIVRQVLQGRAPLVSVTIASRSGRAALMDAPMGQRRYVMLVGMFRDEIDGHLAQLAWRLAAVWFAGLAATSGLGYYLSSRALKPVVGITERAARIANGDFSARLDPPASPERIFPVLAELGIGITAYGVLSRGLLSGSQPKSQTDFRAYLPRFTGENRERNSRLIEALQAQAAEKRVTASQLAIAWVLAKGPAIVPLVGARTRAQLAESLGGLQVTLAPHDVAQIESAVPAAAVAGTRYDERQMRILDSERS